ncbi:hypothetical protein [Caproiciproducens sp.]
MKKAIAAFLAAAITAVSFAGCGSNTAASSAAASQPAVSSQAAESAPASGTWKTGLAVVTSVAKSTDVKDGKGLAETDSTVVAVAVDQDGKIAKCLIDAVQSKVEFSDAGKILTPLDTVVKSKQELGAEYGLGKTSGIKKEWNEQADAFAGYVVGKTADEVKGIAVDSEGKATDKELTASVTIHVGDFIAAVEKAVANAADNGAKAGDKLGLGIETGIASSKDAGAEDGLAQVDSYYTVTTAGADGKITSCIIDASQTKVNFSKAGKITSDLKAEQKTKDELGEAYGMKKAASKIGKEWNEEAAAFAKYVVGKTLDEVKGIAVDSEGKATDKELTASVTIHVGDFIKVIDQAVSGAK